MKISIFQTALTLSLIVHVICLAALSLNKIKQAKKPLKNIEITYQNIKQKKTIQPQPKFKEAKVLKEQKEVKKRKITPLKETRDKFTDFTQDIKDLSKISGKMPLEKKLTPKIKTKDMQRTISVPLLKSEKITNPKYLSYNQTIRQKIRQRAYHYVDHPDFSSGEVYLSFIIDKLGRLQDVHVLNQRTDANQYLKDIGMRSVREAAPFMAFPEDLSYPELTFNVVISFTVDQ